MTKPGAALIWKSGSYFYPYPKAGNLGDVKPVGGGVWEMHEVFGPGWRMYCVERSGALILMLGGGDKSSQARVIELVKQRAKELQDDEQDQDPAV